MLPIKTIMDNQILELQLREASEKVEDLPAAIISELLLKAAEAIKFRDKELWAINDELVKAGFKVYEHETFANCVAILRERGLTPRAADGAKRTPKQRSKNNRGVGGRAAR